MIKIRDLHKTFEGTPVLRGVDLTVPQGESSVIIGASGSGKSVLVKCLLGLLPADSGKITAFGADISPGNREPLLNRTGMLFQGAALFDSLPVWENVAFRLLQTGQSRAAARATALEKLARVGLEPDTADRFPAELSGGMQKRAGLARAIAADPDLIVFDEPTTGLDPIRAGLINRLIRDIVEEMGATAITITHDMTSVEVIADSVAMLHEGRIHWSGPRDMLSTVDDPLLRQFMSGDPDGPVTSTG